MKERLFHGLLIVIVAICVAVTLTQKKTVTPAPLPLSEALVAPTASPHPMDAYHALRSRQYTESVQSLSLLIDDPDSGLQAEAEKSLLALQQERTVTQQLEGILTGMGYEKSLCVLQQNTLFIFTEPAVREKDVAVVLQAAADFSSLQKENIRLMIP